MIVYFFVNFYLNKLDYFIEMLKKEINKNIIINARKRKMLYRFQKLNFLKLKQNSILNKNHIKKIKFQKKFRLMNTKMIKCTIVLFYV